MDQKDELSADHLLTSHEAATLLQVNPSSINNWVRSEKLRAFRTPGGHRRIRAEHLAAFIQRHGLPVPRALASLAIRRVLWVDPDAQALRTVGRRMTKYQERVRWRLSDNAIHALVQVGLFRPHFLVVDERALDIDRLELIRQLKSWEETKDIEMILVNRVVTDEEVVEARSAGAAHVIARETPFDEMMNIMGIAGQDDGILRRA